MQQLGKNTQKTVVRKTSASSEKRLKNLKPKPTPVTTAPMNVVMTAVAVNRKLAKCTETSTDGRLNIYAQKNSTHTHT